MTGVEIETRPRPYQVVPDSPPQIKVILATCSGGGDLHHLVKWISKPDSDKLWEWCSTCKLDNHHLQLLNNYEKAV